MAVAERTAQPHKRHAVGSTQSRPIMDLSQRRIAPTLGHSVHAGNAYVMWIAILDPALDSLERHAHVDGAHADAENVNPLPHGRASGFGSLLIFSSASETKSM